MRTENHVATSDPKYTLEETLFIKEIDEHKRACKKIFLSNVEVFRWLKEQGSLRKFIPAEDITVLRPPLPTRPYDDED